MSADVSHLGPLLLIRFAYRRTQTFTWTANTCVWRPPPRARHTQSNNNSTGGGCVPNTGLLQHQHRCGDVGFEPVWPPLDTADNRPSSQSAHNKVSSFYKFFHLSFASQQTYHPSYTIVNTLATSVLRMCALLQKNYYRPHVLWKNSGDW